jgi:hypothetical protein
MATRFMGGYGCGDRWPKGCSTRSKLVSKLNASSLFFKEHIRSLTFFGASFDVLQIEFLVI